MYLEPTFTTDFPFEWFTRSTDSSSEGCPLHWHESLEIYYVRKGGVHLLYNSHQRWLYPGDIAIVNRLEPHRSLEFLDGTQHDILHANLLSPQLESLNRAYAPFVSGNEKIASVMDAIGEAAASDRGTRAEEITGHFYLLCAYLRSYPAEKQAENVHLYKVLEYFRANYSKPFRLHALSEYMGLSDAYLCRMFRSATGSTLLEYLRQFRCSCAIDLITEGIPLQQVSSMVGFESYDYFSRVFRQTTGHAPSRYINGNLSRSW